MVVQAVISYVFIHSISLDIPQNNLKCSLDIPKNNLKYKYKNVTKMRILKTSLAVMRGCDEVFRCVPRILQ